jgi:hypothetical protein
MVMELTSHWQNYAMVIIQYRLRLPFAQAASVYQCELMNTDTTTPAD